jgi:hypothetical protein
MNRVFQVFALCLSIGLLAFLACRAQTKPAAAPANAGDNANPAAGGAEAAPAVDAAPAAAPEVYFPASKSGGAFLEHQQAPH